MLFAGKRLWRDDLSMRDRSDIMSYGRRLLQRWVFVPRDGMCRRQQQQRYNEQHHTRIDHKNPDHRTSLFTIIKPLHPHDKSSCDVRKLHPVDISANKLYSIVIGNSHHYQHV
jgi:hypothetical protein